MDYKVAKALAKSEAYLEKILTNLEKRGFTRVGDTFYSPQSMTPIYDGLPPWAEGETRFSRVRSFLFVL